jgi:uncharacterized protein (TIGR00251 family)
VNTPFLQDRADGVYLAIKLQPRASREQIIGIHGTELKISVTAPPVDSAANQALVQFLSELLGTSRSQIALVKGQTARHKTIRITGLSAQAVREKLQSHLA